MTGLNNVQKIEKFQINSDNYESDSCGNRSEKDEVNQIINAQRKLKPINDFPEM